MYNIRTLEYLLYADMHSIATYVMWHDCFRKRALIVHLKLSRFNRYTYQCISMLPMSTTVGKYMAIVLPVAVMHVHDN